MAWGDAFLHGQLHEGLRYDIVKGPAVSGAHTYKSLCVAAKQEEHRLEELQKRQQYRKPSGQPEGTRQQQPRKHVVGKPAYEQARPSYGVRKCYICNKPGHYAFQCKAKRTESSGQKKKPVERPAAKQVSTEHVSPSPEQVGGISDQGGGDSKQKEVSPLDLLLSSSGDEEETIRMVRVVDKGSLPHLAKVLIQGVPAEGLVDSGADITIIGGELFRKVAAAARLKKHDFQKADQTPRTCDRVTYEL